MALTCVTKSVVLAVFRKSGNVLSAPMPIRKAAGAVIGTPGKKARTMLGGIGNVLGKVALFRLLRAQGKIEKLHRRVSRPSIGLNRR